MTTDTPKQRLVGRRRPPPDIDPLDPLDPLDGQTYAATDDSLLAACIGGLRPARHTLPRAALAEALGAAGLRRLREGGGFALVVEVPSPDWATHIEAALRELSEWAFIWTRTGASKSQDKTTEGNDRVGRLLSEGARVAGVSQAPTRYLPATLVAAADLYVRLGPPSNRVLAAAIREATGKRPRRLPPGLAGALDFDTLASCIRVGSTPRAVVARIRAAEAALDRTDALGTDVPALEQLHGFGEAMAHAQALVRAVDAWRQNTLKWEDVPRALMLHSEPGLGKTTLVRAIAKAARLPLVTTSVAGWFQGSDGYLGGALRAAEQSFQRAFAKGPAILFIDETESIPSRVTLDNRARDFWPPIIEYMLTALETNSSPYASKLIVIGATNHLGALDPALIRPGRLHPVVRIERPTAAELVGIFREKLGPDLAEHDLTGVAHLAAGATGADVAAWVKGARSRARAEGRRMILPDLVLEIAPPDDRTPEEVRVCACHEAAHAVAVQVLGAGEVRSVTIAMGRDSAGRTRAALHPRTILTRAQSEALTIVALAGRAMDALGGVPNSGAGGPHGSDLSRATAQVAVLHGAQGLGETLIHRGGSTEEIARALREDAAFRRTVEQDLQRLYAKAQAFVREHRTLIEAVADRLVEQRVLSGEEVSRLIQIHQRRGLPAIRGGHDAR
ncbi:AAA family ATPase [Methylobacterium organophilum]|uniref:ATP-dependent zinc metalloprotease FtsH n=1 Tax=Methylobacterium organophilum TaxID=410 RepID=A0ABQ4TAA7_METOR|nr:AAA family ATPase [Methylobacterium organophilum]GJE27529.1 ATP-dependent zinc metalloprotease FtsH [Methylobacterium organophilum]